MPSSILTIEELAGQRRKLALVGAGLPLRGATWAVEGRLVTTWNPGNSREAVQHVLGPTETPSEWEGVWNTTRLISSPCPFWDGAGAARQDLTNAFDLMETFESIARAQVHLRVTWSDGGGRKIVREGRIGPCSFPVDTFDDIRWKASFIWTGRGETSPRVSQSSAQDVDAAMRELDASLGELVGLIDAAAFKAAQQGIPGSASDASLGALESLDPDAASVFSDLSDAASALSGETAGVISASISLSSDPSALSRASAIASRGASVELRLSVDAMGRTPPDLFSTVPRPGRVLRVFAYVGRVQEATEAALEKAIAVELAARRRRTASRVETSRVDRAGPGDAIASHVARAGETFASIAATYYGSADRADVVARANGFPAYQVSPPRGATLLIPVLAPSDAGASP